MRHLASWFLLGLAVIGGGSTATGVAYGQAFPINTDVSLQPARGQWIYRTQLRYRNLDLELTDPDTDFDVFVNSHLAVYGWTSRFSALLGLPLIHRQTHGALDDRSSGVGDVRLLGRYQLWKSLRPLASRSWTVLGGLDIPTHDDPFSTHSYDPIAGSVVSLREGRWGLDADVTYRFSTESHRDVEFGDVVGYDVAVQGRLWPPAYTASTAWTLTALMEVNGSWTARTRVVGKSVDNTGGQRLFLSPGLVAAGKRTRLEIGLQIPVAENLGDSVPEERLRAVAGITFTF